jgi:hypothetical protein
MAERAIPNFHSKAKHDAEATAEDAQLLQSQSEGLLAAIDDLLDGTLHHA